MKSGKAGTEKICRFLRDRPEGASSADIAREILHLKGAGASAQEGIVEAVLRDEERVFRDHEGRWRLRTNGLRDREAAFVVGALRKHPRSGRILALSLHRVTDAGTVERSDFEQSCFDSPERESTSRVVAEFLESAVLVTFDHWATARSIRDLVGSIADIHELPSLSIQRLGKQLLGLARHASLQELCDRFGIAVTEGTGLSSYVDTLTELFQRLRQEARLRHLTSVDDLLSAQERRPIPVDFSRYAFSPGYIANLPRKPGVYVMRDQEGSILYVGKTKNLRSRVGSYFRNREHRPSKISRILDRLYHLECIPVGSDLEARLIEARRIRSSNPEINIQRKVHSSRARKQLERNFVAVLPSAEPDNVELFLFAEGRPLRQVRLSRRLKGLSSVQRVLSETYFHPKKQSALSSDEEEDVHLARRYLSRHRDSVVGINVDHTAGIRDLVSHLKQEVGSLGS